VIRRRAIAWLLLVPVFSTACGGGATHRGGGATHRTTHLTLRVCTDHAPRVSLPVGLPRAVPRVTFIDECPEWPGGTAAVDVVAANGRHLHRFLLEDGLASYAVSPDATHITFDGNPGITSMRLDGTHRQLLVRSTLDLLPGAPAWSPDGRRLAFVETMSPAPSGALFASTVWVMNANGSHKHRLIPSVDNPYPTWIDNHHILFIYRWGELGIIDAQNGSIARLIQLPRKGTQPGDGPALSPNGTKIAVGECVNADCSDEAVDVISLSGRLLRRIPHAHTPAWTPSGELLYACCEQASLQGNISRIYIQAGNHRPRVITPPTISADNPRWLG
jgi:WD40-like Beta Propeller Repeat